MKAIKIIPICAAVFLAACGGGGGGDSASGSSTTAATGVQITSSNAADVSAYTYSALEDVNSQGSLGTSLATGVSIDALPAGLLQSALGQLYKGVATQASLNLVTGISATRAVACSGGGSATVTVNAASSDRVQSGDSLSLSAANCIEDGELVNGRVDFVFSNVVGNIGSSYAWSATLAMNFLNFSTQSNGATVQANGNMDLSYSQTGYSFRTGQVSGTSLSVNMTKSDSSVIQRTLKNYKFNLSVQSGTSSFSGDFVLTGSSPKLGNVSFTVKTNSPFKASGISNPYAGSVTVTGTNSSATVTAIDSSNVRIDVDKNGDGVTDDTITTTWANFRSHL